MPDDKLGALRAELRAIQVWDREEASLSDGIDRAVGLEARRVRRREIIDEIDSLLKTDIEDADSGADGVPLSARTSSGTRLNERSYR
jgi:hypothetical protein